MYRFYRYKTDRPFYDTNKKFYVCSYGGCGSQILCHYLGNFGDVYHLHSRCPPEKLKNTGYNDGRTYAEWFSYTDIPEDEVHKYKVIFLYRNPIDVIYSRYINSPAMLKNIECKDTSISVEDCISKQQDLFELENFFDNYTNHKLKNYPIYCIKYDTFWDNISILNKLLNIPDISYLYPIKKESNNLIQNREDLELIYKSLNDKINNMSFIEIR